jgi:hypothetical protein
VPGHDLARVSTATWRMKSCANRRITGVSLYLVPPPGQPQRLASRASVMTARSSR